MGPDGTRRHGFESSVISYGSQTVEGAINEPWLFESSVISYGSQTPVRASAKKVKCLRVVLSHMVVKQHLDFPTCILGLRVVLSAVSINNGQSF